MINSKSELKYIVIQVTITLLIALIPIYFYIDATKNNQDIKDKIDLTKLCKSNCFKNRLF